MPVGGVSGQSGPVSGLSVLTKDLSMHTVLLRALRASAASSRPLRQNGEAYQGINNFLLTMRTQLAGYTSPFWMTLKQANELDAKIRKGESSSLVVYYGQSYKQDADQNSDQEKQEVEARSFRFQKSYRVFNAEQIEGLSEQYHPEPEPLPELPARRPIPHMQVFFDAIDITTTFTGREAYYMAAVDKVYMPEITRFEDPRAFYGVWAHELAHATKAPHRLNRSFGHARFGNTAYAREEIVTELTSCFLGQELDFSAHTLELNASYLENWLRVLRSDKSAIFKHAADAQRACDWLIAASKAGRSETTDLAA